MKRSHSPLLAALVLCLAAVPVASTASGRSATDTLQRWNGRYDWIESDGAGQIYLVQGLTLVKYSPSGDSLYSWSDPESGRISLVDAGDPFRILVYHPDFNRLRVLNNRLAPLSPAIQIDELGIANPLALCSSRQGGIWILDGSSQRIKYFDQNYHLVSESAPCPLGGGTGSRPMTLKDRTDRLYLHVPDQEILVLDLFGNLIHKIPLKTGSLDLDGPQLLLAADGRVIVWRDAVTSPLTVLQIPGETVLQAHRSRSNLLVRLADRVLLIAANK